MDSTVPETETPPFWTNEKHVDFLNTMEASFVRGMLGNQGAANPKRHSLPLDRYLPDISDSTLDLKPHPRRRTRKLHAPAVDSMGPTTRRPRRRSSKPYNSSQDQVVPHAENQREDAAACNGDDDDQRAQN